MCVVFVLYNYDIYPTKKLRRGRITMEILGIDIGGSGIKGALVNVRKGEIVGERIRLETPQPATAEAITDTVAELIKKFDWKGPVGCTFPAIVRHGVVHSAANVDSSNIGVNYQELIQQKSGCPTIVMNDADAAGVAEMRFGAGKGRKDTVLMLTLGTGIGSALFSKGILMPNTELGHLIVRGKDAEHRASARVREEKQLSFRKWSVRLNEYLQYVEALFSPDLLIIGGGISKKHEKFFPYLDVKAEIVPAQLFNDAGIVGAAFFAKDIS